MGFVSGIKITHLDEKKSVAEVPCRWLNKNPFQSMYFAVQSMAAEVSTAAHVFLALKGLDASVAMIIAELKADFVKKAQSKTRFTCSDYKKINAAIKQLKQADDTVLVTAETIGRDEAGDEVARFYFTWSFKRRR